MRWRCREKWIASGGREQDRPTLDGPRFAFCAAGFLIFCIGRDKVAFRYCAETANAKGLSDVQPKMNGGGTLS